MSGGNVKALPRFLERNPKELKIREGIECQQGVKSLLVATDRYLDQSPEVEKVGSGTVELAWQ